MKPLKDLKGTYGSKDISNLVDFTSKAPVQLPEGGQYHFEMDGSTVHVYGVRNGIKQYNIGNLGEGMSLSGIQTTNRGVEIGLSLGEVERIILHSEVFRGDLPTGGAGSLRSRLSGESRNDGESRGYTGGESRNSGESRKSYNLGESRQTSGESRTIRRSSFGGGESRGGESR